MSEHRGDMLSPTGTSEKACGGVLDALKPMELIGRDAHEQRVAIVKLRCYEGVYEALEGWSVDVAAYSVEALKLDVAASTDIADVFLHR
jgi:hypothetical protein